MSTEMDKDEKLRPIWQLGDDERRMLFITFLGTVAGGVAVVLIVGLGLLDAHLMNRYRHSQVFGLGPLILSLIAIVGVAVAVRRIDAVRMLASRPAISESRLRKLESRGLSDKELIAEISKEPKWPHTLIRIVFLMLALGLAVLILGQRT